MQRSRCGGEEEGVQAPCRRGKSCTEGFFMILWDGREDGTNMEYEICIGQTEELQVLLFLAEEGDFLHG